jgi:hypothetical protein
MIQLHISKRDKLTTLYICVCIYIYMFIHSLYIYIYVENKGNNRDKGRIHFKKQSMIQTCHFKMD